MQGRICVEDVNSLIPDLEMESSFRIIAVAQCNHKAPCKLKRKDGYII
jgi:hypothetical protein